MFKDFFKVFNCCTGRTDVEEDEDDLENEKKKKFYDIYNLSTKQEDKETYQQVVENKEHLYVNLDDSKLHEIDENIQIDVKLIRRDEKMNPNLKFTKKGIIGYFKYLDELDGFELLYEKDNLRLDYRKSGSDFSKDFYLGKSSYKMSKEIFKDENGKISPNLNCQFIHKMFSPEVRPQWDKNIKSIEYFKHNEFNLQTNDNFFLSHSKYNSPVFFISPRDVVDRKFQFYEDEVFYDYTSSIDEENLPEELKPNKDFVRLKTYINMYMMSEDKEFFYFKTYNQVDMKMILPESFFNMLVPFTVTAFYKNVETQMKKMLNNSEKIDKE